MNDSDRTAGQIKDDLDQTRENLADTVDALGEKMRPRAMAESAAHGASAHWPQLAGSAVLVAAVVAFVVWRRRA